MIATFIVTHPARHLEYFFDSAQDGSGIGLGRYEQVSVGALVCRWTVTNDQIY